MMENHRSEAYDEQIPLPRVLSVQSHVVSGYVGNKAATFPLQLLGFDVDVLNSTHLSNHTGYKVFAGSRLRPEEADDILSGLRKNRLDVWTHILTGYVGSSVLLQTLARSLKEIKKNNPSTIYLCDPVMGDLGRLYVPEDVVPVYRDILFPLADIVTPNQFEAETISGTKIASVADAKEVANHIHALGPKHVVITTLFFDETEIHSFDAARPTLGLLGSTRTDIADETSESANGHEHEQFVIRFPKQEGYFTGTGDLFAALLLAHLHKEGTEMKQGPEKGAGDASVKLSTLARACEKATATMTSVLRRTAAAQRYAEQERTSGGVGENGKPPPDRMRFCDLRLVSSRHEIEYPPIPADGDDEAEREGLMGRAVFI